MHALLYTESYDFVVREVASPQPAPDEVLLRVEAAGICASDVDGVSSRSPRRTPPLIMGHELTGEVVAVGGPAGTHLDGARVAVNPQVTCGDCLRCRSGQENACGNRGLIGGTRPGGFAELVAVPVRCIHRIAQDAPAEVAVLTEPLATCLHALSLIPEKFTSTAVVLGGGTIGTLAAQLLRTSGTRRVIVSEPILARHLSLRDVAEVIVAPEGLREAVLEATGGAGADLAIDAVGTSSSRPDSVRILRPGGCALWLGMHAQEATIPAFDMVVHEQRVVGSFAYTNSEFGRALGLLESGRLVPAVSRRSVPLAGSDDVFRRLLDGALDGVLKEIVRP
ncbi:MAG: alcohol dehydrogenase catalytic domain-containing protein [Actinomycetota bacterium]|nr:alcohol dehydrogenase catalytic domain-containing protein [Actinomycetota bacterium]